MQADKKQNKRTWANCARKLVGSKTVQRVYAVWIPYFGIRLSVVVEGDRSNRQKSILPILS